MPSFRLRTAVPTDVDGLVGLWRDAAENAGRPVDTRAAVGALIDRDPDALIVAEDEGVLVGSVIAGWDGWRAHLYRLAVRPDRRRQGIGGALLAAVEERLRALGARRIDAMVLDRNELGQRLGPARGHRRQDEWSRWVTSV